MKYELKIILSVILILSKKKYFLTDIVASFWVFRVSTQSEQLANVFLFHHYVRPMSFILLISQHISKPSPSFLNNVLLKSYNFAILCISYIHDKTVFRHECSQVFAFVAFKTYELTNHLSTCLIHVRIIKRNQASND